MGEFKETKNDSNCCIWIRCEDLKAVSVLENQSGVENQKRQQAEQEPNWSPWIGTDKSS